MPTLAEVKQSITHQPKLHPITNIPLPGEVHCACWRWVDGELTKTGDCKIHAMESR